MAEVHKFPKNGVFTISTKASGAPVLRAFLSTNIETGSVVGHADYTQVVSPPFIHFQTALQGAAYTTGVGPAKQIFALQGSSPAHLVGATVVSSLVIVLDEIWGKTGHAAYTVYNDTPKPLKFEGIPVTVEWLVLAE